MVVSRGLAGFSRGREHLAVVSRAVVTVVRGQSFSDMVHVICSRNAVFFRKKSAGDTGFWEGTRVSGRGHGFLAGDTGFWQGTRVSGRGHGFLAGDTGFWYAKTHKNAYKTNQNAYKTAGNAYKTPGNAYKTHINKHKPI